MSSVRPPSVADRILPLAGVVYALLLVLGAVLFPSPPAGDLPAASDPTWLAQHSGPVAAQAVLRIFAALAFTLLAIAVARTCHSVSVSEPGSDSGSASAPLLGTTAVVGGGAHAVLFMTAQAVALGSALQSTGGGASDSIRALGSLQSALLDVASIPAVLLFAAAGIAGLRGALPRWLAVLSLIGVPVAVIDGLSFPGGPFEAVGFVGLVFFLAWSLLVGIQLVVRPARTLQQRAAATVEADR
ncbi:hypothetical protein [uncultured Amnibacterium sp.]|uniref:hypothetical protein n=1 Tax=uncultured Amnibacterium sp. TaxID=1631851 RepID=UPI0035CBA640